MERTRYRNLWIVIGVLGLLVLLGAPVMGGWMMGPGFAGGYPMTRPFYGMPWVLGIGWGVGLLVRIAFFALIAFIIVRLFRRAPASADYDFDPRDLSSSEILRRRYAAGEITREQYEEMRRVLEPNAPSA
ncbi:MAG TPA: SHOCT domain-containing protein [Chloroflexota bacterium]